MSPVQSGPSGRGAEDTEKLDGNTDEIGAEAPAGAASSSARASPKAELRTARNEPTKLDRSTVELDFLLASLRDLEREHDAGDIDDHDYRTLKDDYTARAAAAIRATEAAPTAHAAAPQATTNRRRLLTGAGIVALAVVAGLFVTEAAGRRGTGGLTGSDPVAASNRVDDCQALEPLDATDAQECYSDVLEALPGSADALAARGWFRVRSADELDDIDIDIDDGLADLSQAISLAPNQPAPRIFRAVGRFRAGDAAGSLDDLVAFYDLDPDDEQRSLADPFRDEVVPAALDACIEADSAGADPVEAVRCYRNVLTLDPGNPPATAYLGWLLTRAERPSEGLALLDRAVDADPELSAAYVLRAATRIRLDDLDGAAADLDRFADFESPPADQVAAADDVRGQLEAARTGG